MLRYMASSTSVSHRASVMISHRMKATASIWLDEPYTPRPPLEGRLSSEICIVGAGIAGLSAAWRMLELGVRPVVLDALTVAGRAAGRNGGFFMAGVAPRYHQACRLWGPEVPARRDRGTLDPPLDVHPLAGQAGARD